MTCTCPRMDGYRIRKQGCPVHGECLDRIGPVPKLDGEVFVCTKPAGHEMPHEAPDGTWWEGAPMTAPTRIRRVAKPPMVMRSIRVPAKLWEAAMEKAAEREENLSDVIRDALERYVRRR